MSFLLRRSQDPLTSAIYHSLPLKLSIVTVKMQALKTIAFALPFTTLCDGKDVKHFKTDPIFPTRALKLVLDDEVDSLLI